MKPTLGHQDDRDIFRADEITGQETANFHMLQQLSGNVRMPMTAAELLVYVQSGCS